jgi:hypothetical protein
MVVLRYFDSGVPEEDRWSAFERRWLELAVGGVPAGFGA